MATIWERESDTLLRSLRTRRGESQRLYKLNIESVYRFIREDADTGHALPCVSSVTNALASMTRAVEQAAKHEALTHAIEALQCTIRDVEERGRA